MATAVAQAGDALVSNLDYRRFTTLDGLPQMQTERLYQDSHGYIYIGTLSGFVRYDGRQLTPLLHGRRENIVGFAEVDGQVRALGFRRQWLVDGDKVQMRPIDAEGKWLLNNFNAMNLPDNIVLLEDESEQRRRLCRVLPTGFETITADSTMSLMTPDRKLFIYDNHLYIPTPKGLWVQPLPLPKGGEMKDPSKSSRRERLAERNDIFSLYAVNDSLYVFASDSVFLFAPPSLIPIAPTPSTLAPDYGVIVRPAKDGSLIMADGHNIYAFDGHAFTTLATGLNLIRDVLIDRWDRLWVATYQGVYCYYHRHFKSHRLIDPNDIVRAIGVTSGNHLVCGSLNGKVLFDGEVIDDQPDNFFLPSSAEIDGCVYMVSRNDLARIDSCGTLSWSPLPNDRYRFVAADGQRLVLGTFQMVLGYNPATTTIDTLSTYIRQPWCAAGDGRGRLYVGSSLGVHCITKGADDQGVTMRIDDKPQFFVTTMTADAKGDIYLASADSLYLIHDGQLSHLPLHGLNSHEVRSLYINSDGYLVVATIDRLFVARIEDGPSLTDVASFDHLSGFSMIEPQQAVMAEMTDGTVWMAGLEEMMSYQPAALLADSRENTFVAPPVPWWQHWWGMALIALTAIGLLALLVHYIIRHRLRRLERDRRQKELQISAIRLKAIPHFHSNVLAGIEYFLMNGSTDEATRYLKLYSDFTNLTLTDIDRPSRSVREEVEYARIYLQLEQLRYGERLTYDINVPSDLPIDTQLPTMVIYTYAQNAVKHGIAPKPEGGHIDIRVNRQAENVVVEVEDNGIGREAAAQLSQRSTKQGLRILMDQVALYNQRNRRHISQAVSDLRSPSGQPLGTRFTMRVPLTFRYSV